MHILPPGGEKPKYIKNVFPSKSTKKRRFFLRVLNQSQMYRTALVFVDILCFFKKYMNENIYFVLKEIQQLYFRSHKLFFKCAFVSHKKQLL